MKFSKNVKKFHRDDSQGKWTWFVFCTNAGWYEGKDILIYSDAISKMRQIRTNLVVEIFKRTVA